MNNFYFTFLSIFLVSVFSQPSYNGWEYLGRGFDIAYGSLRPVSLDSFSASFGLLNIYQVDTDNDIQYTPISVYEYDFNSSSTSDITTYSSNSSAGLTLNVNAAQLGLSGQGSVDFKNFKSAVVNRTSLWYTSQVRVGTALLNLESGRLTNSFMARVNALPSVYDNSTQSTFFSFIKLFGTHYITAVSIGGRQIFWTEVNTTQQTLLTGDNIGAGITINSKLLVNASLNANDQSNQNDANAVTSANVVTQVFAYGGDISKVTNKPDFTGWVSTLESAQATNNFPNAPVDISIDTYLDYITDPNLKAQLMAALVDYQAGSLSVTVDPNLKSTIQSKFYAYTPLNPPVNNSCAVNPNGAGCLPDPNTTPSPSSPGSNNNSINGQKTSDSLTISPVIAALFIFLVALLI